jgi:signal transduction histidine kinase
MSHELRTPLNSLLVLAKLLSENQDGNLTGQQVDFARTIHAAGSDLLQLINDILDLSKVEAGKMDVNPADLHLAALVGYVDATFRPMAEDKGLGFSIEVRRGTPDRLFVDEQRLEQIVRNLLSNAVKFTSAGEVKLTIAVADEVELNGALRGVPDVMAFAVSDTGMGIARQKLSTIFDAFSQAGGATSRRYGGTGLGLSISRDIARLPRRGDPRVQPARQGQHVHAVPAGLERAGRPRRRRHGRRPAGRPQPRGRRYRDRRGARSRGRRRRPGRAERGADTDRRR